LRSLGADRVFLIDADACIAMADDAMTGWQAGTREVHACARRR